MLLNILLLVILILLIPTIYASLIGAPIALTSRSRIKEIIRIADIKPSDKFYELGTGSGRVMVSVAKHSEADVVGFELSPIFYCISLLNLKINGIKKYKLFLKDLFTADLGKADIVFCFLMPKAMEKLRQKFEKELKSGTRIISYAFEIKDWTPYTMIKGNQKLPVYFYKID